MITTQDLLARGYFPKELPPPFNSRSFSAAVGKNPRSWSSFSEPVSAMLASYNLARAGTLRRRLSLVNPVAYFRLCQEVERNWTHLEAHLKQTPLAGIVVTGPGKSGRAVISSHLENFTNLRATSRVSARYLLKADVSRFYHSIYTHSLPWALHTKLLSKANHKKELFGNVLDECVRNCQDKQTLGLPIGPDTSFILSEIILSSVDKILIDEMKSVPRGFRHIDDYELYFDTRLEAERALAILQEALTKYELALNPIKSRIYELPLPLEKPWVNELRAFRLDKTKYDLIAYFDKAFNLTREHPDESVLNYAVSKTNAIRIDEVVDDTTWNDKGASGDDTAWGIFQNLLLHCVGIEPNTLMPALEQFVRYEASGYVVEKSLIAEVMNKQILHHAPLGHNSEVGWAIWTLIKFNCKLSVPATKTLCEFDDPISALLALDARNRGLTPASMDTSKWESYMTEQELYGSNWILSYEANVKGWLPSKGSDHVSKDARFRQMKKRDVSFYDPAAVLDFTPLPESGTDFLGYS